MKPLPVLLSIPHGGDQTPPELMDNSVISKQAMLADSDLFTRKIYGIKDDVAFMVDTCIARVFIDLNRAPSDVPPYNPDGVIKTHSCHGVAIYRHDLWKDSVLVNKLLKQYYSPYHQKIQSILEQHQNLELMLDCHSMEAVGPAIGPDQGVERPLICLGSRFGESCDPSKTQRMAFALRRAFELKDDQLTIDHPFAGGYITQHYGNNPLPCLQIELNRKLYLEGARYDGQSFQINPEKIAELKQKFRAALMLFFA